MSAPTPAQLGYSMPAEWHLHESTWLAWPKNPITWPDRVEQVQQIYIQMISLLAAHERVDLLVDDADRETEVRRKLKETPCPVGSVTFHHIRTVDAWIRDYGPNFIVRRGRDTVGLAFNYWDFNAWGDKYEDLKQDTAIPKKIGELLKVPFFSPCLVLEGGSLEVNGEGACLTTEQCLLNPNRNPERSRAEIERYLRDYLGVELILWLGEGIAGDDTDGHIDDVARFVRADTIVCALEEDPSDENHDLLKDNYERLVQAQDTHGRPFEIVPLPMPGPVEAPDGRLPASYANFYIANNVVLVPTFGHSNDRRALEILQQLFPSRRVVGIPCEPLLWGLGAIHCVTQQQPARL